LTFYILLIARLKVLVAKSELEKATKLALTECTAGLEGKLDNCLFLSSAQALVRYLSCV